MAFHKIIRKVRNFPKSILYMSNESAFGNYGFWVPKSAVLSIKDDTIEIADWCKIKTIEIN